MELIEWNLLFIGSTELFWCVWFQPAYWWIEWISELEDQIMIMLLILETDLETEQVDQLAPNCDSWWAPSSIPPLCGPRKWHYQIVATNMTDRSGTRCWSGLSRQFCSGGSKQTRTLPLICRRRWKRTRNLEIAWEVILEEEQEKNT